MKIMANTHKIWAGAMLLEDLIIFILKDFSTFTNCGQLNMLLNQYLKYFLAFSA